jgi:hypothetical protein
MNIITKDDLIALSGEQKKLLFLSTCLPRDWGRIQNKIQSDLKTC